MYVNIIKYLHLICKPVPFVRFILIGSLNLFSINFKMRQSGDDNIKPVSLHKSTQPVSFCSFHHACILLTNPPRFIRDLVLNLQL